MKDESQIEYDYMQTTEENFKKADIRTYETWIQTNKLPRFSRLPRRKKKQLANGAF